jgi:DNA polymerase (family 10)
MSNAEVIRAFERLAGLMEISGGDKFKILSFRRAADSLREAGEDLKTLCEQKRLTSLPGIGKGIAARIEELLATGTMADLAALQQKFPAGLAVLMDIPGLGPKKVALIHEKLGVTDLEGLKRVIESGELAQIKGMGETSVKKLAEGLTFISTTERVPIGVAAPIAERFRQCVLATPGVSRAEIAGSMRRGVETVGDVDIICDAPEGAAVVSAFCCLDKVSRVLAQGDTKGSVVVPLAKERELQVDLRVVPAESFGAAWMYFTGSKNHNVRLRERAIARKWKLNEYGLYEGETAIAGRAEGDVYSKLGLPWIPPELREDRGELDDDFRVPDLVELKDVRAELHMHTIASDGHNTIEQMAEFARARGLKCIAICDHSKSSTIANGLSIERMQQHLKDIREAAKRIDGVEVLAGTECDILPDGSMDYPDDILAQCDWVVASIHSAMAPGGKDKLSPTERTLAAIENRYVCAIGHPTGRLINRRAAMDLDMA